VSEEWLYDTLRKGTVLEHVYVCGPMTGIPQFNFPLFDSVTATLRSLGFTVTSPSELDDPETRAAALASPDGAPGSGTASDETWGDFLSRDVKLIADGGIQAIVVLEGWEKSRGARLETFCANALCGLPVYAYATGYPVSHRELSEAWTGAKLDEWFYGDTGMPAPRPEIIVTDALKSRYTSDAEVRVVNETTGGAKGQKAEQWNLLPWLALAEVARLYAFGATKYEPHNWQRGYDWDLSFDSLLRHAFAFWGGENIDDETQCSHLASVVFHALALMTFVDEHPELDTRYVA
jgi:hypothetical protein